MRRVLPALLTVLVAGTCSKSELPALDAGTDLAGWDTPPSSSDKPVSLAVDFTVENCPSFDPVAHTCTGKVPLALRFVPLSTTQVIGFYWDFGDSSRADSVAPSHVFSLPGVYTVNLIATGVNGGNVSKEHTGFVVARANSVGEPCESDAQCESNSCLCPTSAGCTGGPPHGLCTSECLGGRCGDEQECANLRTAAERVEPWQKSLCLPRCDSAGGKCAAGLRCRLLPPGGSGGWVHGCFSDMPGDVGDPCRDSNGDLRDDLCATGLCVDFGVLGMCSKRCSDLDSCPPGSHCMLIGDGTRLCLRPCVDSASFPCNRDPLLTCVPPSAGVLGYQVPSTGINVSYASLYCAPRTCTANDVHPCSPSGACVLAGGGSHCVRR